MLKTEGMGAMPVAQEAPLAPLEALEPGVIVRVHVAPGSKLVPVHVSRLTKDPGGNAGAGLPTVSPVTVYGPELVIVKILGLPVSAESPGNEGLTCSPGTGAGDDVTITGVGDKTVYL